jgi:hypothetical protein
VRRTRPASPRRRRPGRRATRRPTPPAAATSPGIATPTAATTQAGPSRRALITNSRHTASRTAGGVLRRRSTALSWARSRMRAGRPSKPRPSKASGAGGQHNRSNARCAAANGDVGHVRDADDVVEVGDIRAS